MFNSSMFTYKPFSEIVVDDLVYLFELDCKKVSKEYLLNKYLYSLSDKTANFLGCIAYDHLGRPAAFVGGMPCLIKENNSVLKSVQIGDVITNPLYRGKGLFVSTALYFFEHLRVNTSYDLIFAFPNEKSSPGFFNKMGWHKGSSFQLLNYTINMFNFYGLFHKFKFITPIYHFYTFLILKLFLRCNEKNAGTTISNFHLVKNIDFLKYKERYSDSAFIKLFGNYYFIKFLDGLQIDFVKIKSVKALQRDLRILSLLFGVKKFATFLTANSTVKDVLLSAGFSLEKKTEWNTGFLFLHDAERKEEFFFSISDTDEF